MRIEILQRKGFHVVEHRLAQFAHRPLPHVDHDHVVHVARDDTGQQDRGPFDQRDRQRPVIRPDPDLSEQAGGLWGRQHREDIIIDERPRKERRGQRSQ